MNAKDYYIKEKKKNTDFLNTKTNNNLNTVSVWHFAEQHHIAKLKLLGMADVSKTK